MFRSFAKWKCFYYLNYSVMDLPYPSQKEVQGDKNVLNDMKRIKSTIWSTKDLKDEQSLSLKTRSIFVRLIEKDKVKELSSRIKKYQVTFDLELGSKQSRWSFLHFCARWNAKKCMQYIIKTTYSDDQQSLYGLINSKSCQGYTPLMIAVIYNSHDFLKSILQFGGVDIFLVDNNRITAYQMAVSSQNQYAIKKLMDYQTINKTSTYINTSKLQQPLQSQKTQTICCYSFWYALKDWMFKQPKNKDIIDGLSEPLYTSRRTSEAASEGFFRDHEFPPCLKSICTDTKQLQQYQIQWYRIEDLYDSDKGIRLFQTYNPFEIIQTTFVLKHNLIVLQLLARNPMLLRRIIYKDQQSQCCYQVYLFPKGLFKRVTVDDYIPCLKDKMQPMFITDSKQVWPLLIQKAWVKTYGSYVAARNIHPKIIMHQLTGFFTQTYELNQDQQKLFTTLKKYSGTGFMTVLTSKQGIYETQNIDFESFTILNFFQKDSKRMFLVNCPFIISKWKQQQKSEPFSLKLLKSHYNTMNQMSIWMDAQTLLSYFQSFTVCHIMDNLQRTQFQIKGTNCLFFKFFVTSEQKQRQKYYLKIYEYDENNLDFYEQVTLGQVSISKDDRIDNSVLKKYEHSDRIKMIQTFSGQYFCKIDLTGQTLRSFNIIIFGKQKLSLQSIDEQMGKIQWLYLLRDQAIKQEMDQIDETRLKKEIQLFNYVLIIIKDLNQIRRCHKITYQGTPVDYVIQGYQELNNTIRMQTFNDEFLFAMIKLKSGTSFSSLDLVYSCS